LSFFKKAVSNILKGKSGCQGTQKPEFAS